MSINFNFNEIESKCIFLIGSAPETAFLWQASNFKTTESPEEIENSNLFEGSDLKLSFKKEYKDFLKFSNRENWEFKLLIKDAKEADLENISHANDCIINLDKIKQKTYLKNFAQAHNFEFNKEEWDFINKYIDSFIGLNIANTLKNANVPLESWIIFFSLERASWYKELKENKLIKNGILEDNIMPRIQYALKASSSSKEKAILKYILANIKNRAMIWEFPKLWESLV